MRSNRFAALHTADILYWHYPLNKYVSKHMSSLSLHDEFNRLETRMQDLMSLCSRLHLENQSLKNQQGNLVEERAKLIEKNELARSKVEQMIQRLKSLENS